MNPIDPASNQGYAGRVKRYGLLIIPATVFCLGAMLSLAGRPVNASPPQSSASTNFQGPPLLTGTSVTVPGSALVECTSACTVTPPTPSATPTPQQICVRNADNTTGAITLAAVSGIQYEVTARTSYKAANTSLASTGTATDQICIIAKDSTHWDVWSSTGTWN